MPISTARERELLNHYGLTTLYPTEWPHEDDGQDDSDEDDEQLTSPLGRAASKLSRSSVSRHGRNTFGGAESHGGMDSLVQKDEPDPLGKNASVAAELRNLGLPVEDNLKLRNRFMLSSTSFSPAFFLSQAHQGASNEELLRGLDFLSRSIEQKSASLKVLVESNFEKFVRAKATIDNVYGEMRSAGVDPRESQAGKNRHSRHASKNSQTHFRNTSGPFGSSNRISLGNDKKKTALTRESEYGVLGIKNPLQDLSVKAEEVWGPALGGREKEETFKSVLTGMESSKELFRLPSSMQENIRKNNYDGVVEDYRKAKKYTDEAKNISEIARENNLALGDADAQQIVLTANMWHDVSALIEDFKRDVWKKLRTSHGRRPAAASEEADKEAHMELMGTLLQLSVDENPIWVWLNSRYLYLRDKIARTFERSRIEIEILRRRLGNGDKDEPKNLAKYLRSATIMTGPLRLHSATTELDNSTIIAFWEKVQFSINSLLSSRTGLLGEVLEFWDVAQSFIENRAQTGFPSAVFANGLEHLQLDPEEVSGLQSGAIELVNVIRENVLSFFTEPPVQDLNDLYSPIPPTPATTPGSMMAQSPGGYTSLSPINGGGLGTGIKRSFSFDPTTVPPPSPSRGDHWEQYAFWPPQSNTLSASHYLSRMLITIGTAANEMGSLSVSQQGSTIESLKILVNSVREQCMNAVCTSWSTDAERCKFMELWIRSADRRDLTTMPATFMAFEEKVLQNMQKIAYISEATGTKGSVEVVSPPPTKVLQSIRSSFVNSLYKALSGMVENAEKMKSDGSGLHDLDGVTLPQRGVASTSDGAEESCVDASNKNVRKLMTLSNLAHLRSDIIPHLVSHFETAFSVKLTDESKQIRDVLAQIDSRLFQSCVKPTVDQLSAIIHAGITDANWVPPDSGPTNARAYVYDVLLALVLVHSEVSTTATALTNQILSYHLEQVSLALIAAFRTRTKYTLAALMQATLDVEFLAQTLNTYTTDRAGEVQSQIYLALDERTDDDARKKLQGELPAMRGILKGLRETTKGEFGCFKKERRGRERGTTSGVGVGGQTGRG